MVLDHGLPIVRACQAVSLSRAAFYRQGIDWTERDWPIIEVLNQLVARYPGWGFWKLYDRARLIGHGWNHKCMHRVYCGMRLNLPRRVKRGLPKRERQPLLVLAQPNESWAMDFVSDALYRGRRFRTLNVLDEGVREGLAIEIDTSLPAARVVRTLEQVGEWRGFPKAIRVDNGPEFIAQELADWCGERKIELRFIEPGEPNQNAYIERFNRTYRDEVLNAYLFENLDQVREISSQWLRVYNEERPHDALGSLPPALYREQVVAAKNSTSDLST